MPTVAVVDGIRIVIFSNDHDPPHFHAYLAEHTLRVEIASGMVMGRKGPAAMESKLSAWTAAHRWELMEAWTAVRQGRAPRRID
ncbi:DUF4160 domain-containing protein [Mesorhizobium sp. LHD-90]|uniref:DUF4160 domain-containing protein n=1 Tax=Mesorhizobium sp. LHD-90 TaxID=3071414 RepID=UPI0027E1B0DA|nr:DUF4160 domain-containing protein [Mesorhizobium sp. LHD-90]MDQ6437078.1 DUF4160 domain-containing protein [Mesorhizobium sp. LHD-90]